MIDFLHNIFLEVFYFLFYEVGGRIVSILIVIATITFSPIEGCVTPKSGWEYMYTDIKHDAVVCEDGTAYGRWNDHSAWYVTGEEEIRCGWGKYPSEMTAPPFSFTYQVEDYFSVYTKDPSPSPFYLRTYGFLDEFSSCYLRTDITLPDPMTELPVRLSPIGTDKVADITDGKLIAAMLGSRIADETLKKPSGV